MAATAVIHPPARRVDGRGDVESRPGACRITPGRLGVPGSRLVLRHRQSGPSATGGVARRAAGLISLFALGHSTTLLIATLAGWRLNPVAVDVVVALSRVFAGVVGLLGAGERR